MICPIMSDPKVPTFYQDAFFAAIIISGGIIAITYLVWLIVCRGPGCKQYPDLPVWLQQLMDRNYLAIDFYALQIFGIIYFLVTSILADIIYHLLAMGGLVELV